MEPVITTTRKLLPTDGPMQMIANFLEDPPLLECVSNTFKQCSERTYRQIWKGYKRDAGAAKVYSKAPDHRCLG